MLSELKSALREILGPGYDALFIFVTLFVPFLFPGILNWLFILSAILVAFFLYVYRDAATSERWSPRKFFSYLVPKEIYLHPSALADYKYYLANSILLRFARVGTWFAALAGLLYVGDGVRGAIEFVFGPPTAALEPTFAVRLGFSVVVVVAADFAKFVTHYLQHKVQILWEFHKVHHSAEVLTPLTNLRVHPVDVALEAFLTALTTGAVIGVFAYRYPGGVTELTILGTTLVYFVFALIGNLRHSHIRLHFGPLMSKIFSSPAMHQVHHSCETRHFDKNFAVIFSFWDYLAKCIWIPEKNEQFRLGIGSESSRFLSLWGLYAGPFLAAGRKLKQQFAIARGA